MAKDNEKIERITIHAVAANEIFRRCFAKAELLKNGELQKSKWPQKLRDALEKELGGQPQGIVRADYNNYLRDKYNLIAKTLKDGLLYNQLGFYSHHIYPLLKYAEIDHVDQLNASLGSLRTEGETITDIKETEDRIERVNVHVLYTPTSFGLINILRTPDSGAISFYNNGDIVFKGAQKLVFKINDIRSVLPHTMFADKAIWLKVVFESDDQVQTAYFAEYHTGPRTRSVIAPKNLLNYFAIES